MSTIQAEQIVINARESEKRTVGKRNEKKTKTENNVNKLTYQFTIISHTFYTVIIMVDLFWCLTSLAAVVVVVWHYSS